jgi:hypothetical protein
MSDDFYLEAAKTRLNQLDYQRQLALTNLSAAKAQSDYDSAAEAVQEIADLDSARERLVRLHQQHVASQRPPQPLPQTPEELRVKPAEKMTWEDGLAVAVNGSRYGKDLTFDDPNVRRGFAEVMRRRRDGENQR